MPSWALSIPVPFTKPVGAGAARILRRTCVLTSPVGAPSSIGAIVAVRIASTVRRTCWHT